jgi:TPR repeat protein
MKIVFLALLLFNFLFANSNLKCEEYNSFKQPEEYINCLNNYIDKNDYTAKKQMARFYYTSQKPYRNYEEALKWYLKIEAKDIQAQYTIGQIYTFGGYKVEKNYKKAAYWYKKASDNGFSAAKANLANFYTKGWGVKKNCTKALQLYIELAEQDIWYAQDALGLLYKHGTCVKKDAKKADYWRKKGHKKQMQLYTAGRAKIEKNLTKHRSE